MTTIKLPHDYMFIKKLQIKRIVLNNNFQINLLLIQNEKTIFGIFLEIKDEIVITNITDLTLFFDEINYFELADKRNRYFVKRQKEELKSLFFKFETRFELYLSKIEAKNMHGIFTSILRSYQLVNLLTKEIKFNEEIISIILKENNYFNVEQTIEKEVFLEKDNKIEDNNLSNVFKVLKTFNNYLTHLFLEDSSYYYSTISDIDSLLYKLKPVIGCTNTKSINLKLRSNSSITESESSIVKSASEIIDSILHEYLKNIEMLDIKEARETTLIIILYVLRFSKKIQHLDDTYDILINYKLKDYDFVNNIDYIFRELIKNDKTIIKLINDSFRNANTYSFNHKIYDKNKEI